TNGNPGSGGLRREFPEMKLRANNQTTPEKIELGGLLYFDPVLSGNNEQSCATCHHPDLGFSDGRNSSMGFGGKGVGPDRKGGHQVRRAAPTIWNAAFNHKQFWDGRANDLEDQARFPITSADEMNQNPDELVKELKAIPEYVRLFDKAFGGGSSVTMENVTFAIAAFERTIISNNSPFDRYAEGDSSAMTVEQRRGLTLFRSLKTRCFECHGFPTFANPDFKVIGVPKMPGHPDDLGRSEIEGGDPYKNAFKVPTLRNVALTAPYMHNGRFQTLEQVIDFYANGGGKGQGLELPNLDDKIRNFKLSEQEKRDLIAFLHALTDESKKPAIPEKVPSGLPVVPRLTPKARGSAMIPTVSASAAQPSKPKRQPTIWRINPGESIQAALDRAIPGDTIELRPGAYNETLLVDVDDITIRGLKENDQRPILDGQRKLTDAVITSSHNFTIENLVIKDYVSNGITVHGGKNATFRDLEVHNAGLYGVYPVECKGVLIERVLATGIKDAAIYVGQSRDIIVRDCEVHSNVTGIEIENSVHALVENNYAHDNTGGILVFLLPNNPSKVGSDTSVRKNRIINNNHTNFGDLTSIVSQVQPGTGLLIMAADRTTVTENEIRGNNSFGIAVVGLAIAFPKGKTFDVGAIPESNRIFNNKLSENGRNPGGLVKQLGAMNVDILWDGSGWDNSFEQPGVKMFPGVLPTNSWPDVFRRAYARVYSYVRDKMM
ncbi:MAG: right-handed parallel beta-helix repeat-containing protein, partial [Acidobacteria bacterium]|nr:right-handed parallel beta-helix repeat-containing protein [Acidobacteriota bacterium]